MTYVKKTVWNKRLPAFSGIVVILIALGITILLSSNSVIFVTKATVGSTPKNMQISNVTEESFTVSYTTDEATTGALAYGTVAALGGVALDDRDAQIGKPSDHRIHFITIKSLTPSTKYYFAITSGSLTETNNGAPFEITTAPTGTAPPTETKTLSGTAALDDGSMPTEGIVSISTPDSQKLTALLQPDGSYTMPLQLRNTALTTYLALTPETKLQLKINTSALRSEATILASQADLVPKIVLSKNYDFTINSSPLAATASQSGQVATRSAFPVFNDPVAVTSPEITTPTNEQQFKDTQPLFKGMALPNAEIVIVINSNKEITAKLQSDSAGRWEFRPPIHLEPGKHTIIISSPDVSGTLQKLSKTFIVNAAGSQFTEPSVSPIGDTPTKTPPITPTIAALPTPTVTPTASPSATMTPMPTTSITPTRGPLTATGSSVITNGIFGTIIAIGIGALLFVFTAI